MIKQAYLVNRVLKKIWIALAILIILAAVFSSLFRSLTPWAKQYKGEVEQHMSTLLGQPVTIGAMETGWYWFEPVLKLKDVVINEKSGQSLQLAHLLVGINLFKSLWQWHIQPGVLAIDDIHLELREKDGFWRIDGISSGAIDAQALTPERTQKLLVWLAEQEQLVIRHLFARIHFQDGSLIPISGLNLSVVNHGGRYTLKGSASLAQTNSTSFTLLGDLYYSPYHFDKTKGQIFFSAKKVLPAQWQNLFPKMAERLEGGKGNIDLWLDLEKGAVASIQAKIKLKRLAWRLKNTKSSQLIQNVSANLLWKPSPLGWQLQADTIQFRSGGIQWPENQLMLSFDKTAQSYQLFVKSLILESLFVDAIDWPKSLHDIVKLKPHGLLSDLQIVVKGDALANFLTRFDNLGWRNAQPMPNVTNLSGVLHWQPEEGRLELDSEKVSLTTQGYPTQKLDLLNGAFEWKALSDGLRISIERILASQPELTISAEGVLDGVSTASLGHVRLSADFSAKNITKWFVYLPKAYLKPRLYAWLNDNLKQIADASGKMQLTGLAKDFPFDLPTQGDFTLVSHASGGEITIGPQWKPLKGLEGYIKVNRRLLDIDLVQGDFNGLAINAVNLNIADIGKDKETLLLEGRLTTPGNKIQNFIKDSPLNNTLSALNELAVKGDVDLHLNLEIPLYTGNGKILAAGELNFNRNVIAFKDTLHDLHLEDFSGTLHFNEAGIVNSPMTATIFGYPWAIQMESILTDNPYTQILSSGQCNSEFIKNRLNLPLLSFIKGVFFVESTLKLTNNSEALDSLKLVSNLQGLKIDLPAPIGKAYEANVPLEVDLDFKYKKTMRFRANYAGLLSSDLLFQNQHNALDFQSGQIRLGSAYAIHQDEPGLAIVGKLDAFALHEWSQVIVAYFKGQSQSNVLPHLRIIDVTLGKFALFHQVLNQLSIKAQMLPNQDWSFRINQRNVSGDLLFHPKTNTLAGHIKRLHITPFTTSTRFSETYSQISPQSIPNLNLRIDNVSLGEMKIGNVVMKSTSSKDRWSLEYSRIESPFYRFNIQGDWLKNEKINKTHMQLKWHVTDLAKSLELWQITPVVNSKNGDMEFTGGWNKSLFDFSLASLHGSMKLQLKNGIITHLSKETEEKLGLGKLLSILSLQTIPRRLQLDFSDLSQEGFSFDLFKGNFTVNKGIMSTQDSYLDGPVAYAGMQGELDLVRRLYNLNLKISPHITASLPLVATIAGGPIAGLAAWVANKIINKSMQNISAYSYKVSGPWKEPIVQQLNIIRH